MIGGLERGLGAWTGVTIRQPADLLEPKAGHVAQGGAREDTDEGAKIDEARPSRDSSHILEYAPGGTNFLWVARRTATYELARTRYP